MREKLGQTPIDPILSEGKSIVEEEVKNSTRCSDYKSGVLITQVHQKADPPELVIEFTEMFKELKQMNKG